MRFRTLGLLLLAGSSILGSAQQPLSNQSIVKMHDAGLGDDLLITAINNQPGTYTTSTDDLVALKKAGLADKVIAAMLTKGTSTSAPVNEAVTQAANASGQAPPPLAPSAEPAPADAVGKPRVFLTAASHGPNQNAARDQSMEMSKDFERDCTDVRVTINQQMADYTVSLNHVEIGAFVRDNQFQIGDKNGDLISKTSEGGSIAKGVKKACTVITADWNKAHAQRQ